MDIQNWTIEQHFNMLPEVYHEVPEFDFSLRSLPRLLVYAFFLASLGLIFDRQLQLVNSENCEMIYLFYFIKVRCL